MYSFIGYNEFGGHSNLELSEVFTPDVRYQDQFTFKNLELGFMGLYTVSKFQVGLGTKLNYHFEFERRYYYENRQDGHNGWQTNNPSYLFNNWSFDAGLRVEYPVYRKFVLATEGWFGLKNLSKIANAERDIFVKQNHFRLLLAYRF